MPRKHFAIPVVCLVCLMVSNCSMTKIAADQTTAIFEKAVPTFDRESDTELAELAGLSNLKMLEGLLEVTPDNPDLLLLTSSSFTRYAYGFLEEKIEIADVQYNFKEKERLIDRAVDFYERGKNYGLRLMDKYRNGFSNFAKQDLGQFAVELEKLKEEHVPALFWTAFSWGCIVNLKQSEPARLAELSRVELMMERVLELDERFFFGGAHLFYGTYYGIRPEMLGGNPERSKTHLERAMKITEGKFLMSKFLLAKCYAIQTQNKELFERTLKEILEASPDLYPEQRLANELAKRRARHLLDRVDDLFFQDSPAW